MIEESVASDILTDVQSLLNNNEKEKAIKTIDIYLKNLEIAVNPKIKKLIEKHKNYLKRYGEEDKRTIRLSKKIDKMLESIYRKKEDV